MHVRRSLAATLATGALLLTVLAPASALAATTGVECGVINAYTAPDPLGPTDGSIQFGFSGPVETIAAAATLDPAVEANLANYVGNGSITCVDVTADGGGIITAMAFASGGVISGPVTYDSVNDAYIVDDRIFAPASQLVTQPELVPVLLVPFEAGEPLTVDPDDRHGERQSGRHLDVLAGQRAGRVLEAATCSSTARPCRPRSCRATPSSPSRSRTGPARMPTSGSTVALTPTPATS